MSSSTDDKETSLTKNNINIANLWLQLCNIDDEEGEDGDYE